LRGHLNHFVPENELRGLTRILDEDGAETRQSSDRLCVAGGLPADYIRLFHVQYFIKLPPALLLKEKLQDWSLRTGTER
jgi:hypothetical protein